MFNKQYLNTSNLPNGVYQNQEIDIIKNRLFIGIKGDFLIYTFQELANRPVNVRAYYSPSFLPLIDNDVMTGSVFEGLYVPTEAYKFIVSGPLIYVKTPIPELSLTEYVDQYHLLIQNYHRRLQHYQNPILLLV